MIFQDLKKQNKGINIMWVVVFVILISIALVITSFTIFVKSGAYGTVKQISAAYNSISTEDLEDYDTKSPIQAKDIEDYSKTLNIKVKSFDENSIFSNEIISEKALGY